jgi:hypothetical protein
MLTNLSISVSISNIVELLLSISFSISVWISVTKIDIIEQYLLFARSDGGAEGI